MSKAKLDFALTDDRGAVIEEQEVPNTERAVKGLFRRWGKAHGVGKERCLVCLEPTGHYTIATLNALVDLAMPTWLAHPRDIQKSIGLQRGKSDKVDALRIAEYARRFKDKARLFSADNLKLGTVKQLFTRRRQLVEERKRYAVQVKDLNPCLELALRKEFDRFDKRQIAVLDKAIAKLESRIEEELRKHPEVWRKYGLLRSVPGVGLVLAAYLLATTDGFLRFPTARSLACQAGVVPYDHSSGTSVKGKPRISRQADLELKTLLHMSTLGIIQRPGELRSYYLRKVAEGKSKMCVINALRNKLIHRIYAVLGRGEPYRLDYTPGMQRVALAIL